MAESPTEMGATRPLGGDDLILPFQTERSGVTGRVVRLGSVADAVLSRHDYPEPVSRILGEALALTALLGASLKFEGKLILQTKTDGPIDMLVVDFETPGKMRGYARYDAERLVARIQAQKDAGLSDMLLGSGHLALTIDQGADMDRYQGIVALNSDNLSEAADTYFRQSEQLPTFIRLAVGRSFSGGTGQGAAGSWGWRVGGLMIQYVTPAGGDEGATPVEDDVEPGLAGEDHEDWQRARFLAETVEDHELLDPLLAPERLLYRLFHEEGVNAVLPRPLEAYCQCSRERIKDVLDGFTDDELADMREDDGGISVTCEFCSTRYNFSDSDIAG